MTQDEPEIPAGIEPGAEKTEAENPEESSSETIRIPEGILQFPPEPSPETIPIPELSAMEEESQPPETPPAEEPIGGHAAETIHLPEEPWMVEAPAPPPVAEPPPQPVHTPPPPPPHVPPAPPQPLSPSDERTWAMLAHLSILVNLVTGFLGPIIPLVIYLIYKDRSRYVAYQSMQAFVFQLIGWIGAGILAVIAWTISGVLAVVLIGLCLMPIALLISLIPVAALVYGVIAGIEVNQGKDFKYWLVGDWVRGILAK